MRRNPSNAARTWSFLFVIAVATSAAADEPSLDGSPPASGSESDRPPATAARESDDSPADEVTEGESEAVTESPSASSPRRSRRRWSDGPSRIPTPGGRSLERARALDLGSQETGSYLLHHPPRPEWKRAAGAAPRSLRWPVDIGAIGRGFGFVRHDRPNKRHNGWDIATPRGMVIRAAADGIVAYANNEIRGYGSCILIVHANGWVTLYAHQDRITVQPGYRVRRGERIGFVGATGRADGPHLHFELHVDGAAVDPRQYFEGEPWVRGRERLAVLRRNHGGHTYGHLGEIEADYGADGAARPAERPASRARTATRAPASVPVRTPSRTETAARVEAPARVEATPPRVATRAEPRTASPTDRDPPVVRTSPTDREPPAVRDAAAARPTTRVTTAEATTPRVPTEFERWFASGPTTSERRTLRGHPITTYAAPIRVASTSEFRAGQLRYEVAVGTNVRVAATGRVVFIGRDVRGARTTVLVIHENGFISIYSGSMDTTVRVGALVEVGDRLGIVRDASFGFLFELLDRGQPLDPRNRFAVTPAVVAAR